MAVKMPHVKFAKTSYTYGSLLPAAFIAMLLIIAFIFVRTVAIAYVESDYPQLLMCTFTIICALICRSRPIDSLLFAAFFVGLRAEATGIFEAYYGIQGLAPHSGWLVPYLLGKVGLRYWWCLLGQLDKRFEYAVVDTGSQYNIMSAKYADRIGLPIAGPRESFTLANSTMITSEGFVEADWVFQGEDSKVYRLKFHVIKDLHVDLLIGSDTLKETETLSRNFHRVRRMLFFKASFAFPITFINPPGSSCQLLHGTLAKRVAVQAIADTGAVRNIMDADWAKSNGFCVQSGKGERTFLLFADKSVQRTLGTVKTQWTFQDGSARLIMFHVLHNCAANVILGEEFLYKHKVFPEHSDSLFYIESTHRLSGLFHFGLIPKAKKIGFLGKRREISSSPISSRRDVAMADRAELHRQDQWDTVFNGGRTANRIENEAEDKRRKDHEVWRASKLEQQMTERLHTRVSSRLDPRRTTRWM